MNCSAMRNSLESRDFRVVWDVDQEPRTSARGVRMTLVPASPATVTAPALTRVRMTAARGLPGATERIGWPLLRPRATTLMSPRLSLSAERLKKAAETRFGGGPGKPA